MTPTAENGRSARNFFRYGELPLVLLALVKARPRHGYELMHELARLFGPDYKPSAGSVYPAVNALESEGLIESETDEAGNRRVYRITKDGRAAIERRRELLAEVEIRTGTRLGDADDLADAVERFARRVLALSGHVDPTAVERVLDRTAARLEELHVDGG